MTAELADNHRIQHVDLRCGNERALELKQFRMREQCRILPACRLRSYLRVGTRHLQVVRGMSLRNFRIIITGD